jgi:hypothetical protein
LQSDVAVVGNTITGTVKKLESYPPFDITLADLGFTAFSFMSLTVTALAVNEAVSIIENFDKAGCGSFVPPVIRQGLKTIREAAEKKLEGERK